MKPVMIVAMEDAILIVQVLLQVIPVLLPHPLFALVLLVSIVLDRIVCQFVEMEKLYWGRAVMMEIKGNAKLIVQDLLQASFVQVGVLQAHRLVLAMLDMF